MASDAAPAAASEWEGGELLFAGVTDWARAGGRAGGKKQKKTPAEIQVCRTPQLKMSVSCRRYVAYTDPPSNASRHPRLDLVIRHRRMKSEHSTTRTSTALCG